MKTPRIRGRFSPRRLRGETIWLSADDAWVVLPRSHLESLLGHALPADGAPKPAHETDFGVVMGTGPRREDVDVDVEVPLAHVSGAFEAAAVAPEVPPVPMNPGSSGALRSALHAPPVETDAPPDGGGRRLLIAAVATLAVGLGALGTGVFLALNNLRAPRVVAEEAIPEVVEVVARPAEVAPEEVPQTAPDAGGLRYASPPPTVTPAQRKPAWQAHIDAGWAMLAVDPEGSADQFRHALARYPRHGDAHHGLGMALLAQGERSLAADYLCEAQRLDRSLDAPIDEVLADNQLSCDDR